MNCTDVSRILDHCTLKELTTTKAAAFDAHVANCEACADQHAVQSSLATFRADVPALPASLQARAFQLHEQFAGARERRPTRRPVLIGSLFLLGAAATMFSVIPPEEDTATA